MHTRVHTHVHTDTHSETYLHLQPGQQRSRDATSAPTPAPGRKQTALPTQTQKLRPRPCHTAPAHAHQENRGNTGRDAHTEANTRVRGSMLSRQNSPGTEKAQQRTRYHQVRDTETAWTCGTAQPPAQRRPGRDTDPATRACAHTHSHTHTLQAPRRTHSTQSTTHQEADTGRCC